MDERPQNSEQGQVGASIAVNPISEKDQKFLEGTFKYHAPKADQPQRYEALRAKAKEFAELVIRLCPESRERSLALTHIQESVMCANAAVAIYG